MTACFFHLMSWVKLLGANEHVTKPQQEAGGMLGKRSLKNSGSAPWGLWDRTRPKIAEKLDVEMKMFC